ncbi:MAG: hypothetical protein HS108_08370 [Planctomycetes bacterium]|nr:hypothetical protein [Planctomycetota bacterium]MCL4731041.1 hypothetical protein [Planctomycetota bacterium]
MTEHTESAVAEVRRFAAAGDYTSARRRLGEYVAAHPELDPPTAARLDEQRRTLEVLESLEVIRQLLREGKTASAARAADGIREALTAADYARLGIVGAALALLGRAGDLARRAQSGDRSATLRDEMGAFVEHLAIELNHLQTEQVDRRLQAVLEPATGGATLGDLLSRRPWKSNLLPAVPPEPEPARASQASASVPATAAPGGDGPVIGRILIAQEQQERVAPVAQPQPVTGRGDAFDLVGGAALRYWHVVAFVALLGAAIGWMGVLSTPETWQSSSILQKSPQSIPRAPLTGRPETYVSSLPSQTALQLAALPTFHERIARRLSETGWAEDGAKPRTMPVTRAEVTGSLKPTVENTGGGFYSIRFTATSREADRAQAIAAAAAEEFQKLHFEHITREADANLSEYEQRQRQVNAALDKIHARRLEEFAVDAAAVGVTIKDRIDQLLSELRSARQAQADLRDNLAAARQQANALREIAERIPPLEEPRPDPKLEALRKLQTEIEKELYDLLRRRGDFGPEHPMQRRIRDLQEDLRLTEKEVQELERAAASDLDRRRPNPQRAAADSRAAEAAGAVSLAEMRYNAASESIPRLEGELSGLREKYLASESLRREESALLAQKERYAVIVEELTAVRGSAARELTLIAPAGKAHLVPRQELVGIAAGLVAGLVIGIGVAVMLLRRRQLARMEAAEA